MIFSVRQMQDKLCKEHGRDFRLAFVDLAQVFGPVGPYAPYICNTLFTVLLLFTHRSTYITPVMLYP